MSAHRSPVRPVSAVLIAVLVVLLPGLAGCATIPRSGPVISGRVVDSDPRQGAVQVSGDYPVPGDTAEGVVSGFLRASAGFAQSHEVARSYLTPQRRQAWRPDAVIQVYPGEDQLTIKETASSRTAGPSATPPPGPDPDPEAGPGTGAGAAGADVRDRVEVTKVVVSTPVDAVIDSDGRYEQSPPGKPVETEFTLKKVNGQWRINSLADGILVSAVDFRATFRVFPVYFGDPSGRYLVPDMHWFPVTRGEPGSPQLATSLVRALLKGPSNWLRGAVVTGAPDGTRMAVAAVVVANDTATVELTERVRDADNRRRQLLVSQLEATLSPIASIGVEITVDRVALTVPAADPDDDQNDPTRADGRPVVDPKVDTRPVVIDLKGRLARLDDRTLTPVKDLAGLAVPGANRPAVSADSSAYAVLNADRSRLLLQMPGAKAAPVVGATELTAPSFDPLNWVWTAPGTNTGHVYATTADSGAIKVKTPWLKGKDVVSLRLSRDGARAVVAVRSAGSAHLFVTGVVRDRDGRPLALTQPPRGLLPDLRTVSDVAWLDQDQVVLLGRRAGDSEDLPWTVQIGGTVTARAPAPGAESISAGNAEQALMAGTPTGLLAWSGSGWDKVATARWPAFPG